jgi:hypothetical protein
MLPAGDKITNGFLWPLARINRADGDSWVRSVPIAEFLASP